MHANAFGSFLLPEQIQTVRDYFNKNINGTEFNDVYYDVDYWFHTGEILDQDMLFELASYDHLWGNCLPQPKIAADVNYEASGVRFMGKNEDSVKIKIGTVDFVAFKNPELVQTLKDRPNGHATIVARPQLNEWNGSISIQMIIEDIDIFDYDKMPKMVLEDLI